MQAALDAAAAPPEGLAAADDSPAELQQTPAPTDGSSADVAASGEGAAADNVMTEAEACQAAGPAAVQAADVDMPSVDDATAAASAAASSPAASDAAVAASSAINSEQTGAAAPVQPLAEAQEPPPQQDDEAAQPADIAAPVPCVSAVEPTAASAAESPTPAAAEVDAAVQAASPAADTTALESPVGAASPAGDAVMGGDTSGNGAAAASPACGDQLPYTTPMNVISNPLYASHQRT